MFNLAQALNNLIYQVVGYLRWPKALQMYKNITQFTASDSPAALQSLARVIIIGWITGVMNFDAVLMK